MDFTRKLDKLLGAIFTFIILSLFFWKKLFIKLEKKNIRSVLVIKLSGFGDYVLLRSTLYDIKKQIKPKRMILLTFLKSNFEILSPDFIDVIIYLRKEHIISSFLDSLLKIRKEKFDLVIDFTFTAHISAILTFFSGAKFSIGYKTMGFRKYLYHYTLNIEPSEHTSESYYKVVRFLLDEPLRKQTFFPLKVAYDLKFKDIFFYKYSISNSDLLIGIHPFSFASGTYKKYGISERYSLLAEKLVKEFKAKIIFTGCGEEGKHIKKILKNINSSGIIACINLSLNKLFTIIANYNLFISIDSGPMHVASLMGIPTIGLFGPDAPMRYGPIGTNCSSIYHKIECSPCIISYKAKWKQCADLECMNLISIDEILEEAKRIIRK